MSRRISKSAYVENPSWRGTALSLDTRPEDRRPVLDTTGSPRWVRRLEGTQISVAWAEAHFRVLEKLGIALPDREYWAEPQTSPNVDPTFYQATEPIEGKALNKRLDSPEEVIAACGLVNALRGYYELILANRQRYLSGKASKVGYFLGDLDSGAFVYGTRQGDEHPLLILRDTEIWREPVIENGWNNHDSINTLDESIASLDAWETGLRSRYPLAEQILGRVALAETQATDAIPSLDFRLADPEFRLAG